MSALALLLSVAEAQDIRGGEITYQWLWGTTYSFDIVMYTQTNIGASHDTVIFDYGDSEIDTLSGTSISYQSLTEWNYSAIHTFPGPGNYSTSLTDSFRIASIQNIGSSSSKTITLQLSLLIGSIDTNSSPVLLTKQPSIFSDGNFFYHSVNAFDPNGDSLSYTLNTLSSDISYYLPAGANIDPITGDFQMPFFNSPHLVILEILEWRDGAIIGRLNREMIFDSTATTSTETLASEESLIKLYPNPVQNMFTVESAANLDRVMLYSVQGELILEFEHIDRTQIVLNISGLSSGVYIIIAYDSYDRSFMGKLVAE